MVFGSATFSAGLESVTPPGTTHNIPLHDVVREGSGELDVLQRRHSVLRDLQQRAAVAIEEEHERACTVSPSPRTSVSMSTAEASLATGRGVVVKLTDHMSRIALAPLFPNSRREGLETADPPRRAEQRMHNVGSGQVMFWMEAAKGPGGGCARGVVLLGCAIGDTRVVRLHGNDDGRSVMGGIISGAIRELAQ
ncbi:hypothetical protein BD779DRAFT_1788927 [Infundibulicybe gibba]|nr:hypothetical protein BD779DRAFT_1788927 [Infundibulicybe gibba]